MASKATWCLLFLMMSVAAGGTAQSAAKTDGWAFAIELYMLASSIDGDASLGRVTGVDIAVDFGDILDTLDVGAMIHFEAINHNKWGIVLDYGFMDLGDTVSVARNGVLEADVRQGVLEAFVLRRFSKGPNTLDVYGGVRWWDNDLGATVDLMVLPGTPSLKVKQDWIDPVIGVRWHHPISGKWDLMLRGDIGGFGVESDFTSALGTSVFWNFKPKFSLELAYRATWVDFEDGTPQTPDYFAYDTVTHGPLVGLVFRF
ncbi:MAG: hypothetical protein O7F11_04160 [Acidobacteria bacterium]|nr:hypothetical protein [Acidobacteriota bacterium]